MQRCQILNAFQDKMLFGKYTGVKIIHIRKDYLQWMWLNGYIKCTKRFFKEFKKDVLEVKYKKKYLKYNKTQDIKSNKNSRREESSSSSGDCYGGSNCDIAFESMMSYSGF